MNAQKKYVLVGKPSNKGNVYFMEKVRVVGLVLIGLFIFMFLTVLVIARALVSSKPSHKLDRQICYTKDSVYEICPESFLDSRQNIGTGPRRAGEGIGDINGRSICFY